MKAEVTFTVSLTFRKQQLSLSYTLYPLEKKKKKKKKV